MTTQLDLQISESLQRVAATVPSRGAGFGDVRRRARIRRQRNLAFAAVPVVLGTAAVGSAVIGMRPADPSGVPSANASDTVGALPSTTSIGLITESSITESTVILPSQPGRLPVGAIICLNAGAGAVATAMCIEEFGGPPVAGTPLVAGSLSADSFVMPMNSNDATYLADAEWLGNSLGLPVHAYEFPYVPEGVDFSDSSARVFIVLGLSDTLYSPTPNTAPNTAPTP
ncbi:hypothetical protein BH10ACT2_BH10ACT2_10170 [soil metagenome]